MAISTINKGYTKDMGKGEGMICPQCMEAVDMRLFTTTDTSLVTKFKQKNGDSNIAICPKCASVFAVADNYMKEKLSGTTVFMTASDLTLIVKGK